MRFPRFFALLLAAVLAGVWWYFTRGSQDEAVRAVLRQGVSLLAVTEPEPPFERLRKAKEAAGLCTIPFRAHLPEEYEGRVVEVTDRQDLVKKIAVGRVQLSKLELTLAAEHIEFEQGVASVRAVVSALGSLKGAKGDFFEQRRLLLRLRFEDGEWRLQEVEHLENLRD